MAKIFTKIFLSGSHHLTLIDNCQTFSDMSLSYVSGDCLKFFHLGFLGLLLRSIFKDRGKCFTFEFGGVYFVYDYEIDSED